jgi:acyl-CoA synthetase (AMP-forming)/AMP-acid ligase II/acyl carrier protein
MVTHGQILANQRAMRGVFGTGRETTVVGWLPHHHDMGLIGTILHPLYVGGRAILLSPEAFVRDPAVWMDAIDTYEGTISGGPTFAYQLAADRLRANDGPWDLRCWRTAFVGAEPVRGATLQAFAQAFGRFGFSSRAFVPCYGLAEATLLVTARAGDDDAPVDARDRVGCGSPAANAIVRIVHPERRTVCAKREVGEIWIKGPAVALGYWNRPAETAAAFGATLADGTGPYLRTQDLGYEDDGNLFVVGRAANLLIVNGQNHYAEDVESALRDADVAIAPAGTAVFAIEHQRGERIVAAAEVRRECLRGLDEQAVLRRIRERAGEALGTALDVAVLLHPGSLPRTTSGKPAYDACRRGCALGTWREIARWEAGPLPASGAAENEGPAVLETEADIRRWIVDQIVKSTGAAADTIDVHQSFAALGLQSVDVMAVTERLSACLGRELDPTLFWEYPSIAEVAAHLGVRTTAARAGVNRQYA